MRMQNPQLTEDMGLFLVAKSTRAVEGGLQWTFDPLHKTRAPRPFEAAVFGEVLKSISTPTLVVKGEHGFRLEDERDRLAKLHGHRLAQIPGVGHMIHWFEPEALASVLTDFFTDHAP